MKKLLFILSIILLYINTFGQTTRSPTPGFSPRANQFIVVEDGDLSARNALLVPRYADTTEANTYLFKDTLGAIIYTYGNQSFWGRQYSSGKRWVALGSGGAGTTYTAADGLTLSGTEFQFGGPVSSPAYISNNRNIMANRKAIIFGNGVEGAALWQFSDSAYSPFQYLSRDTVSVNDQTLSYNRPLTGLFARRTLFYNSGIYRINKSYGHYFGQTYNFLDSMSFDTQGGDYNQTMTIEARYQPRGTGRQVMRASHGTGNDTRIYWAVPTLLVNTYFDNATLGGGANYIYGRGHYSGVNSYVIAGASGASPQDTIQSMVYYTTGGFIGSGSKINKSYLFAPASYSAAATVDSSFGWYDTARVTRSLHAGNYVIGAGAQTATSNTLQVYGTLNATGATTLGNLGGSGSGVVAVDNNGLLSWSAAGSSLFPTTGTGTATGNVIGDLDGNVLKVRENGNDFLSIDPTAGAENVLLQAINTTDDDNSAAVGFQTNATSGFASIGSVFNGGVKAGGIEVFADATTSTITHTADSHVFIGRLQQTQGADVASAAGAIALGTDGNSFEITGTAAITLISNLSWQNGAEVTLVFTSTATLTDGTANSGTDIGMELAGNANFTASADDVLTLVLTEVGGTQRWREKSRSVN